MRDFFDYGQYWNRNCSEWNNSSLKRRYGDYIRSNKYRTQHSEIAARIILHNLKVVLLRLFHQSRKSRKYKVGGRKKEANSKRRTGKKYKERRQNSKKQFESKRL